ncbi:GNAT family N-acetyltransferase [Staphylococcus edaphicus]|uniref:GNAT family N-acetyltransferase n=1 Tax=Staphylococcus edaphicus TaxID=1955013 RepID=A0A2C6WRX0_9STAP|nr:GNAT family N-acetyltransferase [Staphylococcus edaphicus]PHK50217.1 GNAT family N-acetyltransferase [Staphylococcus edaphicus]UQW82184.1 GNAT family N-acetyltransferase [Staphylococcus edaphicus]
MKIVKLNNYDQIVKFINEANYHYTSYLYKLPQAHDDVEATIRQSLIDPGVFAQIDNQGQIEMLMLAFKYEANKYKVLGPFVRKSLSLTEQDFKTLFEAFVESKPDTANFNFSFEETEQDYMPFMKEIEASYSFTDYHLISTQDIGKVDHAQNITEYRPAYHRLFEKLHNDTFKHDVMSADEIIESLDSHNKLFVFMSEGLLKGYLYLQIFESTKKAEIKYFSSHSDYRLMGIAFDLLSHALQFTFTNYAVDKIYFKIRSKNNTLVERFHELGFNINYEYKKFKYVNAHI